MNTTTTTTISTTAQALTSATSSTTPVGGTDTPELYGVVASPMADRMMVVAVLRSAPDADWQQYLHSEGARAVLGDLRPRFATDRLIVAVPPHRTRPAAAALAVAVDVINGLIGSGHGAGPRRARRLAQHRPVQAICA